MNQSINAMQIHQERPGQNAIQSYNDAQVTINGIHYHSSLILCKTQIISTWPVHAVDELDEITLQPLLHLNPEIILIGHLSLKQHLPIKIRTYLSEHRIGVECLSLGAACRTYNVLLSEERSVVMGLLFHSR